VAGAVSVAVFEPMVTLAVEVTRRVIVGDGSIVVDCECGWDTVGNNVGVRENVSESDREAVRLPVVENDSENDFVRDCAGQNDVVHDMCWNDPSSRTPKH
jgi:hypothetical protein